MVYEQVKYIKLVWQYENILKLDGITWMNDSNSYL